MADIVNEHEIIIAANTSIISEINLGLEYSGISHILLIGDDFIGKILKIYQWSELAQGYFPIYSIKDNADAAMQCAPNKCIFFNQFILTGNKFQFELDSQVASDSKIILFKVKK